MIFSIHILLQQRTIFKYDQIKQLGHCSNIISFRLFVQHNVSTVNVKDKNYKTFNKKALHFRGAVILTFIIILWYGAINVASKNYINYLILFQLRWSTNNNRRPNKITTILILFPHRRRHRQIMSTLLKVRYGWPKTIEKKILIIMGLF